MTNDIVMRTQNVTKVYSMGKTKVYALRGIDFTVRRGEMIAIIGASGSGKSTLMNIIGCLDYPTEGTYLLDNVQVERMSKNKLADIRNQKIGFIFQGFNLLPRTTALENVELPLLYDRSGKKINVRQLALQALERVGLGDRVDHEPNELSGGQQQRVAIARALVSSPSILLADEPTGNLDSRTSIEVLALFQELHAQGMTILLVTHEQDIATCAERIIELKDGRIIRDEQMPNRRSASAELQRLQELEPEEEFA